MPTSSQNTSETSSITSHDPARVARVEKAGLDIKRRYSADMNLWVFCRNTRCYRVRDCRGDANGCIERYAPLVPEDVRDGARLLLCDDDNSGALGSVEDVILDDAQAAEALADWDALVMLAQEQKHEHQHG